MQHELIAIRVIWKVKSYNPVNVQRKGYHAALGLGVREIPGEDGIYVDHEGVLDWEVQI